MRDVISVSTESGQRSRYLKRHIEDGDSFTDILGPHGACTNVGEARGQFASDVKIVDVVGVIAHVMQGPYFATVTPARRSAHWTVVRVVAVDRLTSEGDFSAMNSDA